MIAHFYPGLDIYSLTYPEIDDYLSQISYVAPLCRIRYYLRDIKNLLFSMFTQDYQPNPELDEDETLESRKSDEDNYLLAESKKIDRIMDK